MPDTRTVKKIFNWKPLSKRSQGRPRYRWEDNIKHDICQMKIKNWIACVQDRGKWKEVIEKAKTYNYYRKFSAWKIIIIIIIIIIIPLLSIWPSITSYFHCVNGE
jgi:uncharacterized protein VirK/YbjX